MKTQTLILFLAILLVGFGACKNTPTTKTENTSANTQTHSDSKNLEVHITGMTCEIGCAKIIESKIAKMKGVSFSKVIFKDSIGKFTYDATITDSKTIIAKIDGIADGDTYKVTKSKEVMNFFKE